jgi:surfeit locus 1 family protein
VPRRIIVFVVLAVAMAALFVRLGFWQLSRLAERRARNATMRAQLGQPEVSWAQLKRDAVHTYRRVVLEGVPDTANEFVVTGRSRDGSPGVHIITPVRIAGDSAVLVNRGWVYAPDAATADLQRWRERRTTIHGYTLRVPDDGTHPTTGKRAVRNFGFFGVHELIPYATSVVYVVEQDSGAIDSIPARLALPALNNGPHLNYAIQWFAFAIIAIAGAVIVARRKG